MILLGKIHILFRSCYKWTEHAVYFPVGTISLKTGENVVPAHASGFPAIFEFSVVFAVIPKGCLQVALVVAGIYNSTRSRTAPDIGQRTNQFSV